MNFVMCSIYIILIPIYLVFVFESANCMHFELVLHVLPPKANISISFMCLQMRAIYLAQWKSQDRYTRYEL